MIRVLIADDNAVIRQGLGAVLASSADIEVVAEAATGRQAIELAERHQPDVVLLDVRMPVMDGVTAAATLSDLTKVLMLTHAEEPATVAAAIRNGAIGYLVHGQFEPPELAGAIRRVCQQDTVLSPAAVDAIMNALRDGETVATAPASPASPASVPDHDLTEREAEVMDHIAQGRTNAEIAETLYVVEKTVKNHINRIYTKLGVRNRAQAIARWLGTEPHDGTGRP